MFRSALGFRGVIQPDWIFSTNPGVPLQEKKEE